MARSMGLTVRTWSSGTADQPDDGRGEGAQVGHVDDLGLIPAAVGDVDALGSDAPQHLGSRRQPVGHPDHGGAGGQLGRRDGAAGVEVLHPEQLGHPRRQRAGVDLLPGAGLKEPAVGDDDDLVGQERPPPRGRG